ncbi:MAG: hypothetical protein HKO63_06860 [Acidimicrobiia bacterium]|nr:hypothetical protein [Acidimicrobiia bacterium]MBT8192477.1 hypothetical protein [Acidimicrobiia bacterium]MBT8246936.1 hypothetical protein [Acidimicrobiia bacterium]NNJ47960.1 hypothetical protein [Acidimicrobiia bacterium]NNL14502.1 hypothetical protein [Acidimicrobiia bacterium]
MPTSGIDFEGVTEVANWTIDIGTGDHEKAAGTGEVEPDPGPNLVLPPLVWGREFRHV